jgi:outer membrane protein OmpA-like peptidoglycan-associated protein
LDFICRFNDSINDLVFSRNGCVINGRNEKINEATQAENQRSSEILDICTSIQNDAALKNKIIAVDCKDNRINFGEAGRFGHNDYRLNAAGVEALNTLVPIVLNAANSENGKKWFKQIVIEGFTDTDGSYLYNLNLSLRRSEWVMCSLLDPKFSHGLSLTEAQKNQVKQLFLAGGFLLIQLKIVKKPHVVLSYGCNSMV